MDKQPGDDRLTGYVERIVFRNADNAYTVLELADEDGDECTLVGTFPVISEGDYIEAEGTMKLHPVYGEQLSVLKYTIKMPEDTEGIRRYLSSGAIKGIGEALAKRIVKIFGDDTLRIIEEEPERLAQVKGISERMAVSIGAQAEEKKDMRDAMIFLGRYGISMNLALKIYKCYGMELYHVIRENPYKMADDIEGVGFKIADDIASHIGISVDSGFRIKSGTLYVLLQALGDGDMYLPEDELFSRCSQLLGVNPEMVAEYLQDMQIDRKIFVKPMSSGCASAGTADVKNSGGTEHIVDASYAAESDHAEGTGRKDAESESGYCVYAAQAYYTELGVARMLHDINLEVPIRVITGGPGTGKTTTIKNILAECREKGLRAVLAAPTGRAAKRMTEATGYAASTIHRLLEVSGAPQESDKDEYSPAFGRDESNPLEADVVIIDEMSMVDIYIMYYLLKAVPVGARLVLVGDVNQLPSVGPGNVLRDIIDSGRFDVKKLTKIYRQSESGDIILNAHRMIAGDAIDLEKRSRDFLFIRRNGPDAIISAMLTLIQKKLPDYVHADPCSIQVLTPMRKGALGTQRLNTILQAYLNPPDAGKVEKELFDTIWREGDKVMQTKNNYQMEWRVQGPAGFAIDKGTGVFNGDIGRIREINLYGETVTIEFDEGRVADYGFDEMGDVELAYAVTIHKSQGSEYPAVVIPVYSGPESLLTRNLIYTAITRAVSCVCLVGQPEYFYKMVGNTREQLRYSGLKDRILEIC
jgi:exodeoxyribonuclease V alpha subunit